MLGKTNDRTETTKYGGQVMKVFFDVLWTWKYLVGVKVAASSADREGEGGRVGGTMAIQEENQIQ